MRRHDQSSCSRRRFLRVACSAGALGGAAGLVPLRWLTRPAAAQSLDEPGATRIVLLGTQGGPNFNAQRGETASAVVVAGHAYLVDCGYGTLAALGKAGLNYRDVAQIFLTHLHDDHTADLAALLGHQWTDGRVERTSIYGPVGTRRLVAAALEFDAINAAIRLVDEQRSVKPESLIDATDLEATSTPAAVYRDERIAVTSIENTHFPNRSKKLMPYRSLAYRIDAADRAIAYSGDTNYSPQVVALARGADVFVCEAIDVASMRRAFDARVAKGAYADHPEGIWQHIVATHTSTQDAGRMASEAGVGMLVLNHLVPGALADVSDDVYVAGVRAHYSGRVVVARDQTVL